MNYPKVSICIPAYNQSNLLEKLLESILIQDFKDYEIVVTDDSLDSSVEKVCLGYIAKNIPITYVRNVTRKGSPENWNEAMRHAKGEYIKIMHHDDWFLSGEGLGKFVAMLDENKNTNFAFSGSCMYDSDGKLCFKRKASKFQIYKLKKDPDFLFAENFVSTPSATIFRRDINIFFDPNFKWVVDFDFYAQAIKITGTFEYTQEFLVGILVHSEKQVTAKCENDKIVQLTEYIGLYKKINSVSNAMKFYVFRYFWNLFCKFKIKSVEDIKKYGNVETVPRELASLVQVQHWFFNRPVFFLKKKTNRIKKVFEIVLIVVTYFIFRIKIFFEKI